MAKTIPTRAEGHDLVGRLMGNAQAPARDELVAELRGDPTTENAAEVAESEQNTAGETGAVDTDPAPLDTPNDVLNKLRKAQQEAGSAGHKLGKAREELAEKEQRIAQLEAAVSALQSGASPSHGQSADPQITKLTPAQLDQLMSHFDDEWSTNREDPYKAAAAQYAANLVITLSNELRGEISGVAGGVENMQFDSRLSRLGIDRAQFDAVWTDPAYAWGRKLSNVERLAALEAQAKTVGSLPHTSSGSAPVPNQPVARPTSRVSPRTIETSQGAGSAANPIRLRELEMNKALETKDFGTARKAATTLFEQLMAGG